MSTEFKLAYFAGVLLPLSILFIMNASGMIKLSNFLIVATVIIVGSLVLTVVEEVTKKIIKK